MKFKSPNPKTLFPKIYFSNINDKLMFNNKLFTLFLMEIVLNS